MTKESKNQRKLTMIKIRTRRRLFFNGCKKSEEAKAAYELRIVMAANGLPQILSTSPQVKKCVQDCFLLGYNAGIKAERQRRHKEVL